MSAELGIPVSLETALQHGAAVKALSLVGLTALLYDHLLTLELEINLIWKAAPGFVSVVFLLNRYLVPLMLIVDTYELAGVSASEVMFCKVWTGLQSALTLASFISIHAIVAIRVYALHYGRPWIRRFLWSSGTLYLLSTMGLIVWSGIPVISTLQPVHHACVGAIPWYLWTVWLPSVIFESLLFVLTLCALLSQDQSQSFSKLTVILFRDGMIYFVAVSVCSSFCLLVWAFAPPTLNGLARYFALAMVNIVSSRMVLNLKHFAASQRQVYTDDSSRSYPSVSFVSYTPSPASHPISSRPPDSPTPASTFDLEMYSIERDYQQLGSRMR